MLEVENQLNISKKIHMLGKETEIRVLFLYRSFENIYSDPVVQVMKMIGWIQLIIHEMKYVMYSFNTSLN